MTKYLSKFLQDMPKRYKGYAATPAANHLFEVNETAKKISKEYTQIFHTIMDKILFLIKQE